MDNMEVLQDENVKEIEELVRENIKKPRKLRRELEDYHDNDIAHALEVLTKNERLALYPIMGIERTADVFSYLEEPEDYISEINIEDAVKLIPSLGNRGASLVQKMRDKLVEHRQYIRNYGCDLPEVENWKWDA